MKSTVVKAGRHNDARLRSYVTHRAVSVSPVPRKLAIPPCDTQASKGSPVSEERGSCPFAPALEQPEDDPDPGVAVAEAPAGPYANETPNYEDGASIEGQREEPHLFLLLFREAQPSDGAPGDMPRQVEERGE